MNFTAFLMMSKYQIKTISTQKLLKKFKFTNIGEYSDLYLLSDILLLTVCLKTSKRPVHSKINLIPVNYFTSPGLSWNAKLKMTDANLILMSDIDRFQCIER